MRILMSLTYYRPNVSGLTIYVERLAARLVERGHAVTVLTAQHDPALAVEEYIDGVRVVRATAPVTVGKAPLMPRFADTAYRLAKEHDVVHLHLPQLEAALAAGAGRKAGKPVVLTYHCDLQLPAGLINRGFDAGVFAANYTTATLADQIVAFQIPLGRLEGKWKLNQNHPLARRQRVIAALRSRPDEASREIAGLMEERL